MRRVVDLEQATTDCPNCTRLRRQVEQLSAQVKKLTEQVEKLTAAPADSGFDGELTDRSIPARRRSNRPTPHRRVELKELADDFQRRTGNMIGGERLLQELIRLRKQGRLPCLQK